MGRNELTEVGLADAHWAEEAAWAIQGGWELTLAAENDALRLRGHVLAGVITLDQLRGGVAWANALDQEAVERYGADLSVGEQQAERVARRMMHLAGRSALNGLKNNRLRTIAAVERAHVLASQKRMTRVADI